MTNTIQKNNLLINKTQATIATSIIILLMGIGLFADKTISDHFANQNDLFGTIFQDFGLFPPVVIQILAGAILIHALLRFSNNESVKIVALILGTLYLTNIFYNYLLELIQYINSWSTNAKKGLPIGKANNDTQELLSHQTKMIAFIISILFVIATLVVVNTLLKNISEHHIYYLVVVSIVGFLVVYLALDAEHILKALWGRARPYQLDQAPYYTNWLKINGENGLRSFPSGHTIEGALLAYLALFIPPQREQTRKLVFNIGIIYGVLMAISRIKIKAHFLSDVTAGFAIAILIVLIGAYAISLYQKHSSNKNILTS